MKQGPFSTLELLESRIAPATLTVYNLEDGGQSSLRAAIQSAADGDTIAFADGLTGTIHLTSAISIDKSLTIVAAYQGQITIDGADKTNLLNINDGDGNTVSKINLVNLALANGTNTTQTGGTAISSSESLTLNGCSITSCNNTGYAAGAITESGLGVKLNLINSTFSNNKTGGPSGGGAVYMNGDGTGIFNATGCTFQYNKATNGSGGALFLQGLTSATITKSSITGNQAALGGGGIYLDGVAAASITQAGVDSNVLTGTAQNGGGIMVKNSLLAVKLASVSSNTATGQGGGIYADANSTVLVNKAGINQNNAGAEGGGIYFVGDLTALTSSFKNNHAGTDSTLTGGGGGIYGSADSTSDFAMYYSTVKGNTAGAGFVNGGGLCLLNDGAKVITKSVIAKNSAGTGGGIMAENGTLKILGASIVRNSAVSGAGIAIFDGTVDTIARIIDTYVHGNQGYFSGGGIYSTASNSPVLFGNTINGNTAQSNNNLDGTFIVLG
jgi:predicted outer membrane repeat protein